MPDTHAQAALPASAAPARAAMTTGPVGPLLVSLTLPMVGAVLSTIGYSVAETWFIARLGPQALSAVSFTFPSHDGGHQPGHRAGRGHVGGGGAGAGRR